MVALNGDVDRDSPKMVSFACASNNVCQLAKVAWQADELLADHFAKAICNSCFAKRACFHSNLWTHTHNSADMDMDTPQE